MRPAYLAFVALALLAGSAGYVTQQWLKRQSDTALPPPVVSAPAPAAAAGAAATAPVSGPLGHSFTAPDGSAHRLDEWAGKLLVVNFWATWCPPCLREIPAFVELQDRHGAAGLQFVGIALDQAEPVADFVADKAINYPVLVGNEDVARFMQELGNQIGGLPYTVVFDRDGEVVLTHQGEWDADAARTALEGLLQGS
ncbi:MAG: TlpA family protein disulfide reductase [Gammaproteobacteria bacterium]|nr:TlpA family protein disulfide reductase [Gammaproteobacteria bacterium]MCP5200581.1 TlpA family protein disulfide reductase [Gammaproteobacteria bacterium]